MSREHLEEHHSVLTPSCQAPKRLIDYSQKDKPWDQHRSQSQDVESIYASDDRFWRYAERVSDCSTILEYARTVDEDTGEMGLRLSNAAFCRVRHCPVCQWRRSLMWQARFYQAVPELAEHFPRHRWVFLTLTVRNCRIDDLGETLVEMNKAWNKLIKRKALKTVDGWIRTTEVTRGKDGSAHPHFHVLMMVKPSYFKGSNYLKKMDWVDLWQSSLQVDYKPNLDVRTVKAKSNDVSIEQLLASAVKETLKYSVKPTDMTADPEWFLELTRQLHKKRFIASGGELKNILKPEDEVTDEDLIHPEGDDDEDDNDLGSMLFEYSKKARHYLEKRDH